MSRRIVVDLPAPLGPSRPTQVPSGTSRSRWSTAVRSPKRLTTPLRRSASGTPRRVSRGYTQFGTGSRPNQGLEQRHVVDQRLRVPLDADREAVALDRLDRAVVACPTTRRPSPTSLTAWWWKELTASVFVLVIRCRRDPAWIVTSCVGSVAAFFWRWPSMCWCSVPPQATLSACEPRQMARIGRPRLSARRARLSSNASRLGSVGPSCSCRSARRRPPGRDRDRRSGRCRPGDPAAAQMVRADGREHDGDRSRGVQRAQIGHPERHLGCAGSPCRRVVASALGRSSEVVTPMSGLMCR